MGLVSPLWGVARGGFLSELSKAFLGNALKQLIFLGSPCPPPLPVGESCAGPVSGRIPPGLKRSLGGSFLASEVGPWQEVLLLFWVVLLDWVQDEG